MESQGSIARLGFLNRGRHGQNAVVHSVRVEHVLAITVAVTVTIAVPIAIAIAIAVFLENDLQFSAGRQLHAFAQPAFTAERVEHARDCAGILAEFAGFAFEPIDFLNDLDGDQDRVFLEVEQ